MDTQKFHILTFGCQMNKNDSERIVGLLSSLGLAETSRPEEADVLLINTCSVRQSAEDRVFGILVNWQEYRAKKPNLIIAVTGCMPCRDKNDKIRKRIKGVDIFFPIEELVLLPQRMREINPDLFLNTFEDPGYYWQINPSHEISYQAFITVQTGCNNFCTYCVVPYARGREKNREVKSILDEIKTLAAKGCVEVTLLGQVVNNYQAPDKEFFSSANPFKDKDDFSALLWEINQVNSIKRVHFTAADPQYFNNYQIEALKLPNQANYLHLPVQAGDNEVLRKMNRKYTREYYLDLVNKIRANCPTIALGTDLIVGFSGETEKQFEKTLDLYRQASFDISYPAKYSERSGTAAAKAFTDNVTLVEKKRRWQAVQDLMEKMTYEKNQYYVGKTVTVLVDRFENGICMGNTHEMKLAQFLGEEKLVGKIVEIEIFEAKEWILKGKKIV
ncbi:MAG TPA: tRNA (N6-isopentenyl adenosine(37)-C2)-methylthiotransferase MiaB [Patescibacteria group bacterium]|nr:tRNA (N6-isopentenyl adenosine(37)-C2)-methylthiotransferase MiaB [Patescibacteria group bacterium]